jgi:hypothetical protein
VPANSPAVMGVVNVLETKARSPYRASIVCAGLRVHDTVLADRDRIFCNLVANSRKPITQSAAGLWSKLN